MRETCAYSPFCRHIGGMDGSDFLVNKADAKFLRSALPSPYSHFFTSSIPPPFSNSNTRVTAYFRPSIARANREQPVAHIHNPAILLPGPALNPTSRLPVNYLVTSKSGGESGPSEAWRHTHTRAGSNLRDID